MTRGIDFPLTGQAISFTLVKSAKKLVMQCNARQVPDRSTASSESRAKHNPDDYITTTSNLTRDKSPFFRVRQRR